jgi:hypothetical protein
MTNDINTPCLTQAELENAFLQANEKGPIWAYETQCVLMLGALEREEQGAPVTVKSMLAEMLNSFTWDDAALFLIGGAMLEAVAQQATTVPSGQTAHPAGCVTCLPPLWQLQIRAAELAATHAESAQ